MKSALEKIFTWVKELPLWAQDAFRRIYENSSGDLSETDIDEVTDLLKKSRSISETKLLPRPPGNSDNREQSQPEFVFKSVGQLKNVNAIDENAVLCFKSHELTVIYGDNGSGKSGYIRMLKGACYARYQKETIHPNIFSETPSDSPASAEFKWKAANGTCSSQKWSVNNATPLEILQSSVAVFDSKCARVYVDENNKLRVEPYGLEMLDKLASGFKRIGDNLQREQSAINIASDMPDFPVDTKAGDFVRKLRQANDQPQIVKGLNDSFEELANISDSDWKMLSILEKEKDALDPKKKAGELEAFLGRFVKFYNDLLDAGKSLSSQAVDSARAAVKSFYDSKKAVDLAKNELDAYLTDTGGELWKCLLRAAKDFSFREAYRGEKFPFVESGAKCVLCQQPLSDEGSDNLRKFGIFLVSEVEKNYQESQKKRSVIQKKFDEASLDFWNLSLGAEIAEHCDSSLCAKIKEHIDSLRNRKTQIISAMESDNWDSIVSVSHDRIGDEIGKARDDIEKRVRSLKGDPANRLAKYRDLSSRVQLREKRELVQNAFSQLRKKASLRECERETNTRRISLFVGRLVQEITEGLQQRLQQECEKLGVDSMITFGQGEIRKGKPYNRLHFSDSSASGRRIPISEILSEGEHRTIAIAAFLAEVGVYNAVRCIVFDDPVSSLDHQHREAVAKRLIEEAKNRQVIVFTHDLFFLHLLDNNHGVDCYHTAVWSHGDKTGVVDKQVFIRMTIPEMINDLEEKYRSASKKPPADQAESISRAYGKLRQATDALVERKALRNVVTRFSGKVQVGRLSEILLIANQQTFDEIVAFHSKCSERELHLPALAVNCLLSLKELREDIDFFKSTSAALDPPKKE